MLSTPGEHYLAAEADIAQAYVSQPDHARFLLARALVHATLASVTRGPEADTYYDAYMIAERRRAAEAEAEA